MAFRTIVISSHCKLEYSLEYLVYRTLDKTTRIFLGDVNTILITTTQAAITSSLISELVKRKIKVIFCDEKNNPSSEILPYFNNTMCYSRLTEQISWPQEVKNVVWGEIIKNKIITEAKMLESNGLYIDADTLYEYASDVKSGDVTNREGHAAKVYFNRIFYEGFTRKDNSSLNAALNYGYTLLLSQFNKCIVAAGYMCQLGIHHKGPFNNFNFGCDLMEPFRYLVDQIALKINFEKDNFKLKMLDIFNLNVTINEHTMSLYNAINIYFNSVIKSLNTNCMNKIEFIGFHEI